jgi:hypothetical protein
MKTRNTSALGFAAVRDLVREFRAGDLSKAPVSFDTSTGWSVSARVDRSQALNISMAKEELPKNGLVQTQELKVRLTSDGARTLEAYGGERDVDADEFDGYAEEWNLRPARALELIRTDSELNELLATSVGLPDDTWSRPGF